VRQPTKKPPHRGGFFVGYRPLRGSNACASSATRKGARRRRRPFSVRVVKTTRINRSPSTHSASAASHAGIIVQLVCCRRNFPPKLPNFRGLESRTSRRSRSPACGRR